MNLPYLFCLCVLYNLKNEFFYRLDFIFLFLGLFKGPSHWMLGVSSCNTCQKHCILCQTHYVLKAVTIEGKVSPVLTNQSSTFVEPREVSKLASSEAASQRILAGIKTAWSTSFIDLNFQDFLLNALSWQCFTRHTHKVRGGGGFCGKFPRSSSMNTPSYCSRKASALELSEERIYVVVGY